MRSLFYDIHRTVMKTAERSGYPVSRILLMLGISRSWFYSQMSFSPLLDGRFNPMAIRDDDEWIVIGFSVNAGQDLCKIAGVKLIHLIYFFTHSFHLFFLSVKNSFSCPSACMTRPLC